MRQNGIVLTRGWKRKKEEEKKIKINSNNFNIFCSFGWCWCYFSVSAIWLSYFVQFHGFIVTGVYILKFKYVCIHDKKSALHLMFAPFKIHKHLMIILKKMCVCVRLLLCVNYKSIWIFLLSYLHVKNAHEPIEDYEFLTKKRKNGNEVLKMHEYSSF